MKIHEGAFPTGLKPDAPCAYSVEKRLNLRHAGIILLALVAGGLTGCSILDAPPTSQVIYVTATPAPAIDTLSPTPVLPT